MPENRPMHSSYMNLRFVRRSTEKGLSPIRSNEVESMRAAIGCIGSWPTIDDLDEGLARSAKNRDSPPAAQISLRTVVHRRRGKPTRRTRHSLLFATKLSRTVPKRFLEMRTDQRRTSAWPRHFYFFALSFVPTFFRRRVSDGTGWGVMWRRNERSLKSSGTCQDHLRYFTALP
jgi:hypothetical protein